MDILRSNSFDIFMGLINIFEYYVLFLNCNNKCKNKLILFFLLKNKCRFMA